MAYTRLICIVDDQADYRFLVKMLFQRYLPQYAIELYDGGKSLLEKLATKGFKPSLIILDYHMPHFDGYQTLLALKGDRSYQKIPVVMMSSEASYQEINDCYEAGANSFLKKELDFSSIHAVFEPTCNYWLELNQEACEV